MSSAENLFAEPPQCSVYFEPKLWSYRYSETFFTAVVSTELSTESPNHFTIKCKSGENQWFVTRTLAEFQSLLAITRTQYQQLPSSHNSHANELPQFPIKQSNESSDYEERAKSLQTFIDELLQRKDICQAEAVRTFFTLDRPINRRPSIADTVEDNA